MLWWPQCEHVDCQECSIFLLLVWSKNIIYADWQVTKTVLWKGNLWIELACSKSISLWKWIKRQRGTLLLPNLQFHWASWFFLRTWVHFHNFYFQPFLRLYWPCVSFGILDYSCSQAWMQKQCLLIQRLHRILWKVTWTVSRFFFTGICWCNPFCLIKTLKSEVTALKKGSLLNRKPIISVTTWNTDVPF